MGYVFVTIQYGGEIVQANEQTARKVSHVYKGGRHRNWAMPYKDLVTVDALVSSLRRGLGDTVSGDFFFVAHTLGRWTLRPIQTNTDASALLTQAIRERTVQQVFVTPQGYFAEDPTDCWDQGSVE